MLNAQGAVVAVTGFLLLGGATSVLAAGNGEFREQSVLQGSKLTLCQAIATAEQYTGARHTMPGRTSTTGNRTWWWRPTAQRGCRRS